MKQFEAPFISNPPSTQDFELFSLCLGDDKSQFIDNLLWSNSGYEPQAAFCMAYASDSLLLKFTVHEKYIKADHHQINDPVHKDSCVEVFIAFNNDPAYYNLEFNYLGTAMAGYGKGKNGRVPIEKQQIEKIKSNHFIQSTGNESDRNFKWQLILSIPFGLFQYHRITSLENQVCKVNFYKCGDDLPEPHYLSWNKIVNPEPNFHLPGFFGEVYFLK